MIIIIIISWVHFSLVFAVECSLYIIQHCPIVRHLQNGHTLVWVAADDAILFCRSLSLLCFYHFSIINFRIKCVKVGSCNHVANVAPAHTIDSPNALKIRNGKWTWWRGTHKKCIPKRWALHRQSSFGLKNKRNKFNQANTWSDAICCTTTTTTLERFVVNPRVAGCHCRATQSTRFPIHISWRLFFIRSMMRTWTINIISYRMKLI